MEFEGRENIVMRSLIEKLKEAAMSVLPIFAIVIVLFCTSLTDFSKFEVVTFLISTVLLIFGIGLFSLGADLAMTPMGSSVGAGLAKKRKLGLLCGVAFLLGFLITIAEPDLSVLGDQVNGVMDKTTLIVAISVGVALFIVIGIFKIIFKKSLSSILMLFYMLLFALGLLVMIGGKSDLLPLAFDSGGVTTGPITVPFLMSLGLGIAHILSGKNAKEDSFGFVALCSVGPILVVLLLSIFSKNDVTTPPLDYSLFGEGQSVISVIIHEFLLKAKEVLLALGMIVAAFIVCQLTFLKLPLNKLKKIFVGILYTFIGLVIFLASVTIGYMPVGFELGKQISTANKNLLIPLGFLMGMLVVLAEPAVHIFKKQVE